MHELAHWLTDLVSRKMGVELRALPGVIREGIASYTEWTLLRSGHPWQAVAAAWARKGTLKDVPPPLWYDVGASLVSYLVKRDGKHGFLQLLPSFAMDWGKQAEALAPGWMASLREVEITEGIRALYEAELERLGVCSWMLAPVIPEEARELIEKLLSGEGSLADITRFWEIISVTPPAPSAEGWEKLSRREDTFRLVQYRDGDRPKERTARPWSR